MLLCQDGLSETVENQRPCEISGVRSDDVWCLYHLVPKTAHAAGSGHGSVAAGIDLQPRDLNLARQHWLDDLIDRLAAESLREHRGIGPGGAGCDWTDERRGCHCSRHWPWSRWLLLEDGASWLVQFAIRWSCSEPWNGLCGCLFSRLISQVVFRCGTV